MDTFSLLAAMLLFYLPLTLAVCSFFYHLAVVLAAFRFRAVQENAAGFTPPVSILKPVNGIEQGFYSSLASHFRQDYPEYEIVFGVSDSEDPANWTIAQLRREFPQVPVKVVLAGAAPEAANPKMVKLRRMLEEAAHEVVLINDADIRVPPDYLKKVVQPLRDEKVGLVTCLYRGVPGPSLASRLEAVGVSGEFAGQVLLARLVQGIRFGLGATLATRKKQIAEIGGLLKWADYLADDYILGSQIAAAGYRVHLSQTVVDTFLPYHTFGEMLRHQLRWARTLRFSSPAGYPGLLLSYGVPLALLALAVRPSSAIAQAAFLLTLAARLLSAWASGWKVCRDPEIRNRFWMLPLRDFLGLGMWVASFFGNTVAWGQQRFRVAAGGRIRPA